jgi:hypothetical protein
VFELGYSNTAFAGGLDRPLVARVDGRPLEMFGADSISTRGRYRPTVFTLGVAAVVSVFGFVKWTVARQ